MVAAKAICTICSAILSCCRIMKPAITMIRAGKDGSGDPSGRAVSHRPVDRGSDHAGEDRRDDEDEDRRDDVRQVRNDLVHERRERRDVQYPDRDEDEDEDEDQEINRKTNLATR